MNILEKIILHKKNEVASSKAKCSISQLEKSKLFNRESISLKDFLLDESRIGIIAEFKRKSPSLGIINSSATVKDVTCGYVKAGASALSILTDYEFFGGTSQDLSAARLLNDCPILRKDFVIDEYQLIEAKSIGADVVLLLANVLSAQEIKKFAFTAKQLGLEVVLEIRDKVELESVNIYVDCVGINNRNLKDFSVNLNQSLDLVDKIPNEFIKISESGISSAKVIHTLKSVGFKGFLIGETFMKQNNPEKACMDFIAEINQYKL